MADEISTGLDSATTFDICTSFAAIAHVLDQAPAGHPDDTLQTSPCLQLTAVLGLTNSVI